MKKNNFKKVIIIWALLMFSIGYAQINIKGTVEIDMNSGLINCDFDLSNIPKIEEYRILLNKGMNIKYFKDDKNQLISYNGHHNGNTNGEAIEYTLRTDTTYIPSKLHVTYRGAFPIYKNDEFSAFDYKGIIAFNGETLRATEQTKWYPVIYDVTNDRLINSYTYDLTISIKGGTTIFINGSAPKKGKTSRFVSKKAQRLLLFAGNYDFVESNGNYILNTKITKETSKKVFSNIEIIKSNLSNKLGIVFTDKIYLVSHKAINKRKKGSSWGFNTYPTFAFTALNFDKMLDDEGQFTNNNVRYFGHEFGHNYFGNNVNSGKLKWFWGESFTEYLSYNIAEDLCGKDFLKETLIKQVKSINEEDTFIALSEVKKRSDIGSKYRYILAPLMLKCFEDRFGRDKMNHIIKSLLELSYDETLTLEHWKQSAIKSGIKKDAFEAFEKEFISNKNFKQNIIKEIVKNYSK
ncbi:gluzincin family metallopeptidase [Pontimicrobium aquaticum]|uniref:Peptidase M1 membrane alanine aminopeptidase domain-containing protein n=1 Tax=Pontimicrobium aquaticum TaxID=2565367 RepID=A0A4U0F1Z2_9FLAO|nr:hypothetical protein [Pontimicrobium aquaticum]TJY37794.1 hypothetical protein E5167_00640 [Pontimicrobium aquaticum]